VVSGLLGFWQERGADNAVEKLLSIVQIQVTARRDGKTAEVPVEEVVPGDIVELSAGSGVPGDCLILESRDLFVDEASLTGETYPVEKNPGVTAADTPLAQRGNVLYLEHMSSAARLLPSSRGPESARNSDRSHHA